MTNERKKEKQEVINLLMSKDREDRLLGMQFKKTLRIKLTRREWELLYTDWWNDPIYRKNTAFGLFNFIMDHEIIKSPISALNSYYQRWRNKDD